MRNYIVITAFQWRFWDDKDGYKLQYWFFSKSFFLKKNNNKEKEIWENKNVRLE